MTSFIRFLSIFALLAGLAGGFCPDAYAAGGGGAKEEKKEEGMFGPATTFYVRMNAMVLPVINEKGISEVVSLLIALEVKDQRTLEKVNGMQPKLNDAYVRALYGRIDKSSYRNGRFLDVNKLKTRISAVTQEVLGPGLVDNVLIQGVNQRSLE